MWKLFFSFFLPNLPQENDQKHDDELECQSCCPQNLGINEGVEVLEMLLNKEFHDEIKMMDPI